MKNIHDVLREKETKLKELTQEVKLLRAAVGILENADQLGLAARRRHSAR